MQETKHDYVIVGAGPAGLQLGAFLKKAGRDFVILESGEGPGTFFKKFPRHRKLISANKVYTGYTDKVRNMRWDWNSLISDDDTLLFKHYSKEFFPPADSMVTYLQDFADKLDLPIHYNRTVSRISRHGDFRIETSNGDVYHGKRLLMATGVSLPYIPDVPGIEHAEVYTDVSVDPDDFTDQKVLILGKGNSAFETADNLMNTSSRIYVCSPNPITLSWRSKFVGHLRAVNNNFIDTYQLKLQNVMLDAKVLGIARKDKQLLVTFHYAHADEEIEVMEFDRVIVCTGFRFDASIFDESCRPELAIKDRFPAQTSTFESVNVKDLFFAGTIMQERDFKKKQSGFVHGFRHNIESLSRVLSERYHDDMWPEKSVDAHPNALASAVLNRANLSPGLWQQTGFIGDVLARMNDGTYRYYEDVPTQYVKDSRFGHHEEYYVITLEFGLDIIYASPDPLAVTRIHKDDVENAALSTGIHPIVRRYRHGELIAEHHVLEDIIPEWDEIAVHVAPLERFFAAQQGQAEPRANQLPESSGQVYA
ncbi:MAG: NAD(P)-binding domain-containing protein [Pseudomonadota bacterium]|jgi:thioredoxin reductase